MNTHLCLKYRDADGWSASSDIVLKGQFSAENLRTIQASLWDGEFFIPHQIGLPTPSEQMLEMHDNYPCPESDHVWTIFPLREYPSEFLTDKEPTHGTVADFMSKFKAVEFWDIQIKWERILNLRN